MSMNESMPPLLKIVHDKEREEKEFEKKNTSKQELEKKNVPSGVNQSVKKQKGIKVDRERGFKMMNARLFPQDKKNKFK